MHVYQHEFGNCQTWQQPEECRNWKHSGSEFKEVKLIALSEISDLLMCLFH